MDGGSAACGRVLLVDDDPRLLAVVGRVLAGAGHDVVSVGDGRAALDALREREFDVIVSDIQMPGVTGLELLRTVRERDLDVPVVLMTGEPTIETAMRAVEYGALEYLAKPVSNARLAEVVARATRLCRLARAKRAALELTAGHHVGASDRAGLEVSFERALASLWPAYQPILDRNGALYGHEALLRSREPALPHPGAVIEAAEQLGRLHDVGARMRGLSAESAHDEMKAGFLFVNLHPHDLQDRSLLDPAKALTKMAHRVVLEITERASIHNLLDVRRRVADLRACGYRIAVDDLGAGYAGLTAFATLEPEVVKLDMSLVRDVDTSTTKQKVIRSMTSLCKDMGMTIVAEGVETHAELTTLLDLGCDLYQGYLLAKPGPAFPSPTWPAATA